MGLHCNICDTNLAGARFHRAADIYLSGVWSCFNVQRIVHSSLNARFYGAVPAGDERMPGVKSAFVILSQFKRSSATESRFSMCVERRVCSMLNRGCMCTCVMLSAFSFHYGELELCRQHISVAPSASCVWNITQNVMFALLLQNNTCSKASACR